MNDKNIQTRYNFPIHIKNFSTYRKDLFIFICSKPRGSTYETKAFISMDIYKHAYKQSWEVWDHLFFIVTSFFSSADSHWVEEKPIKSSLSKSAVT